MPVSIPAGTKFEAIKPTTVVNRRSALVNSNDQTFTIEDIVAAAGGGTFPITNNYIPKANALGSLVNSSLSELTGLGGSSLGGNYNNGLYFTYQSSSVLFSASGDAGNINAYAHIGDVFGSSGPAWGINVDGSTGFPYLSILLSGTTVLHLDYINGDYQIGGSTSRFGIKDADTAHPTLQVSPDMIQNILGINYLLIDISGTVYKIQLIP